MSARPQLGLPITLGVVMIVMTVALIVGWVLLSVFGAIKDDRWAPLYYTLMTVGSAFLVMMLLGVVAYLVFSIKAINLSRRQSNFIDSVTHELKSPIASLKLCLQTLNRHTVDEEQREVFYRYMLEDVDRLDQLINHLLDAGRLEKEQSDDEIEDVDLAELLAEIAGGVCLRHRVAASVAALDVEPCIVRARRVDLDMIFRNLIDNAVKYAADEPQVGVRLRFADEETAVVSIQDNGPGIPPKLRRKIFGRFVRLGLELERKKPGTGLGLYIVRTLVGRLRGKVRVYGGENGVGTVFEVKLPARRGEARAESTELDARQEPSNQAGAA